MLKSNKKFLQNIKPKNIYSNFTERYPAFGPRFETPVTRTYSSLKTFSKKYLLSSTIFIFSILVLLAYITTSQIIHRFRNKASLEKQEKLDEHLEDQSQLTVIFLGIIGCVILVYLLYLMTQLNMSIEYVKEKIKKTTEMITKTSQMLTKETLPAVTKTGQMLTKETLPAVRKISGDVSNTLNTANPVIQSAKKNVPELLQSAKKELPVIKNILGNVNEKVGDFELPSYFDKKKTFLGFKKDDQKDNTGYLGFGYFGK